MPRDSLAASFRTGSCTFAAVTTASFEAACISIVGKSLLHMWGKACFKENAAFNVPYTFEASTSALERCSFEPFEDGKCLTGEGDYKTSQSSEKASLTRMNCLKFRKVVISCYVVTLE